MAAPSYGHDLVTVSKAESTTNYAQINILGGGGGTLGAGPDYAMQGTNAVDRQVTTNNRGIGFDDPGGPLTAASNGTNHVYVWFTVATAGLVDNIATDGTWVYLGAGASNGMQFHVDGSETYGSQGRIARCYVVQYDDSANTSFPWRTVDGSPPSPATGLTIFGAGADITGAAKGANIGLDVQRYGTGAFIVSGDNSDPATLSAFTALSDDIENRWGITIGIAGGYELQGGFSIGVNASGQANAAEAAFFQEANFSLICPDLFHCASGFTKIVVHGEHTVANFTNMTMQTVPSVVSPAGRLINPGQFQVLHSGASVGLSGCTFAGIGETVANYDLTAINTTWRDTGNIIQRSGTFTNCTFTRTSGFMTWGSGVIIADDLNRLVNCTFQNSTTAAASGCAIRIRASDAGKPTYTLTGASFAGYGADNTNEAALHYMGTEPITISVVGGDAPTVSPTSLVTVSNDVAIAVQVNDEAGNSVSSARVYILDTSDDSLIAQGLTNGAGLFSATFNFVSEVVVEVRVRLYGAGSTSYLPFVGGGTLDGDGFSTTVRLIEDSIAND